MISAIQSVKGIGLSIPSTNIRQYFSFYCHSILLIIFILFYFQYQCIIRFSLEITQLSQDKRTASKKPILNQIHLF